MAKQGVLNLLAYLEELGKQHLARICIGKLHKNSQQLNCQSILELRSIKETLKGMDKLAAEYRTETLERQPLPASAIRKFCQLSPTDSKRSIWLRDACILLLGFRTMRRASELSSIKRKHIQKRDGIYFLSI